MANLASTAVAIIDSWYDGSTPFNKVKGKYVSLTLTGQGTATNKIPASVLGLNVIKSAESFVISDNSVVLVASPSADGSFLLLKAAGTNAPADYTGTFTGIVRGQ